MYADRIGQYAAAVWRTLNEKGTPQTVPELVEATNLGERLVRMGLDRLLFCDEIQITLRAIPGRRGAWPRAYALSKNKT